MCVSDEGRTEEKMADYTGIKELTPVQKSEWYTFLRNDSFQRKD
jgi:hypothetical protein